MGTHYPVLSQVICILIFSHLCIIKYAHTSVNLSAFIPIPNSSIQEVNSNSTYATCHLSCYSQQNQIYSNALDKYPPPVVVLQDSDFAISIVFYAQLQERRYLMMYYDQPDLDLLFGLWVEPGSSQFGITYKDCNGEINIIPLSSEEVRNETEVFLAVSVSPINSTHLLLSYTVGDNSTIDTVAVSGSLQCSFPPDNKYAEGLVFLPDGKLEVFYGYSQGLTIWGRSLTDGEIELLRGQEELIGENSSYPECLCPKGSILSTDTCCYDPQTNYTSFRITPDSFRPELSTDGNPCTYWQSSPSDQFVSLSLSFYPALSMVQLIRIQFISPPARLSISVTSSNDTYLIAHINSCCEAIDSTYRCIRSLDDDAEESNCCVTSESLLQNSVLEILFSNATPLQDISSLTLHFSQLPTDAQFYSISDIQLYRLASSVVEIGTSTPSLPAYSTLSLINRFSLSVQSSNPLQQSSVSPSNVPTTARQRSSSQSRHFTPIVSMPYPQTTRIQYSNIPSTETDTLYSSSILKPDSSASKRTAILTQLTSPLIYATSSIPGYRSTRLHSQIIATTQIPSVLSTTTDQIPSSSVLSTTITATATTMIIPRITTATAITTIIPRITTAPTTIIPRITKATATKATTTTSSQSLAATSVMELAPTPFSTYIPSSSLLTYTVSSQASSSAFHSTSTVTPPYTTAPPPTPLPPCYQSILPSHTNISVPYNAGYKQLHFTENSRIARTSILPTQLGMYQVDIHIPFGLSKAVHFESTLPSLYKLAYYIHSTTVWDQDPYFRISFLALNVHTSLSYRDTEITVSLTLNSLSLTQNVTVSQMAASKLVTFTIPSSWFDPYISPSLIAASKHSVLINTTLGLQLITSPTPNFNLTTPVRPVLLVTLPTYPLTTDSTVTLSVYLLADTGARYLSTRLMYPPNSSVVNLDPSYQWEFSSNSNALAISGFVDLPVRQNGMFKLFEINLILHNSNATTLSCDLIQVYDSSFNPLISPSSPCYISGPYGITHSTGHLDIQSDSVNGIAAYPQSSLLYNHAVLSQTEIRIPISVYLYTATGLSYDYSLLTCHSSNASIVKVSPCCSYLYTDGSELSGADTLSVVFSYKHLETEFDIKVMFPDIPIALYLEDPILNIVPVFPAENSCVSNFQRSKLIAYANFSTARESVLNIDVLDFVRDFIYVSETHIAVLADDLHLEGVSAGAGNVFVEINNRQIGVTQFVVSLDPVEVTCYSPHVYSDVSVNSTDSLELYEPFLIELLFHRTFLYSSTLGYSLVFLLFSDDTIMPIASYNLSVSNGVLYPGNTFSLLDNSSLYFSLPSTCPSLPSLSFITNIDLYIPDSVSITVLPQILTTDGDSAYLFGYNTSAVLRVLLVYGSSAVDASNAPFTVVVIQNPNLLSRVKTDLGTLLETKHTTGQTQIVVSLPWLSMTKSISIQVVNLEGLQISLFPSRLGTNTYQTGYLQVEAILSYSIYRIITDVSLLTLRVRERNDTPGVITNKAYFIGNILHINSSAVAADTNIIVSASYGAFAASYDVFVSTDSLTISHFSAFDSISNLTGILDSQFAVNFGFTLSDGTSVSRYFQEGLPPVSPDTVQFEVSDPSSISLDSSTGLVSLLGNSEELVFIRVSSGNISMVSNGFAVNLAPNGNGIDVGNEDGLALPHQQVNTTFQIPIWLHTYSDFKSIDISLSYDRAVLSVVKIAPGSLFSGGLFLSQWDPPGDVRLGGIIPRGVSGDRLLIAEVYLQAVRSDRTDISANVNSLSGPFPLYPDLLSTADSVVTSLTQVIGAQQNRSAFTPWSNKRRSGRGVSCSETGTAVSGRAVCTRCSSPVRGDLNRDCVFNLNDVSYLLDYITASYTGYSSVNSRLLREEFEQLPLSLTDINEDTEISIADVYYLNWVNFGLFYFLRSVEISLSFPAIALPSVYSCELVVSVQLDSPPPPNASYNKLYVYIELTGDSASDAYLATQGEYTANTSRERLSSGIYKTDSFIFKAIIPSSQTGELGVSPILLATDGQQIFYQAFTDRSLPTLNYPELRATIPFNPHSVSLSIREGYSPYKRYTPALFCGAESVPLRVSGEIQGRELTLHWPQTGGRGPYTLKKVFCARIGRESSTQLPCQGLIRLSSNIQYPEYTVSGLNPFSVYHFRMEVEDRASQWTEFKTIEADPESLLAPLLTRYNITCIHIGWEEPEKTNGIITGYSLLLNNTVEHKFDYNITSHLLCDASITYETNVTIQANNSVGSVQSKPVLTNTIGEPTVLTSRYDSSCVELAWTQLVFNRTLSLGETFDVTIDNLTVAVEHNGTRLLVCGLVADGIPFLLEITSSRVGKIFSNTITLPVLSSFPHHILLFVLLPLLGAILLLVCCVAVAVCWWKSKRYAMFKMQKNVGKSKDYWSTEEDFVEVSPVDIQPLEKRLFVNPQTMGEEFERDRSGSFESSDSWMEPILDVEKGIIHEHAPQHSFDSTSFNPGEAQDDTSIYTNPTIGSQDRSLNPLTPRKAHSLRGRSRVLAPASDLRKAKMSHSWHNLRHKRYLKQSLSSLERKRKHNGTDTNTIPSEDYIPVSDVSSEVYYNTPIDPIHPVIEAITPLESSDSSTDISQANSSQAPTQPVETDELRQDLIEPSLPEQNTIEVTPTEENTVGIAPLEEKAEDSISIEENITEAIPLEESTIPVTLSDPSQPVSKPLSPRTPAPPPIQDETPPSLSEVYSSASEYYEPEESHSSTEGSAQEATVSTFVRPIARPSLDLSEGHVMEIALGLETGQLPLEENKPTPYTHKLSFTALPKEESLGTRRSIFQPPGELYPIDIDSDQ